MGNGGGRGLPSRYLLKPENPPGLEVRFGAHAESGIVLLRAREVLTNARAELAPRSVEDGGRPGDIRGIVAGEALELVPRQRRSVDPAFARQPFEPPGQESPPP